MKTDFLILLSKKIKMNYPMIIMGMLFGMAFAVVFFFVWENRKKTNAYSASEKIIKEAEKKRDEYISQAKNESTEIISKAEKIEQRAVEIEQRAIEREEKIQLQLEQIQEKYDKIVKKEEELKNSSQILNEKKIELDGKLSEISKLTEKEAREIFLKEIQEKYEKEGVGVITKYKKRIEDEKKEIAKDIILKSIQQYAGDVTSEVTTTLIEIPSDDIKGKLIGKEGRNITTFERAACVTLIIDDTPDTVFISAFDLFKRYIAKKSLEKLIEDGRIQPARIEEVIAKTEKEAEMLLKELGTKVLEELGIINLPEEIAPIIGKLRFRTSYGQNILKHSKETAIIGERIAIELGVDPMVVKIGGLLHDIGKAIDQDYEGTHPEIGGILARKYKLPEKIIDIIENHHGETFSISIETAIIQVADAISSVRPGARREVIEDYLKRVQEMEALVQSFSGVSKAYALSAGREIRVFVNADTISDLDAAEMAKNIAEKIQEKLSYPGEVKVNLIREMRVIEFAK